MNFFETLIDEFERLEDPRVVGRTIHSLHNILIMGTVAIICQAESWVEIANFSKAKFNWFKKYLSFDSDFTPSHDTFERVFSLINPPELELAFYNWINNCRAESGDDIICIDGKTVHGTVENRMGHKRGALHLVNAWSAKFNLFLGQVKSNTGNCESTAAQDILDFLDLNRSTVVCDAGVGRRFFLEKVISKNADYVTPVKKNSRGIYDKIEDKLAPLTNLKQKNDLEICEEKITRHGRVEKRTCGILRSEKLSDDFFKHPKDDDEYFPSVSAIGFIVYELERKENRPYIQTSTGEDKKVEYVIPKDELRKDTFIKYFITSMTNNVEEIFRVARLQWSIENKLHWALDVGLSEDACRVRNKITAQNMSLIRKISLNFAKKNQTRKGGMKTKLKMAGWDDKFLEELLFKTNF